MAFEPLQLPEAVHDVALLLLHVSVDDPPLVTVVGAADSDTVGGVAPDPTVTVVDCVAEPPGPVQVSE